MGTDDVMIWLKTKNSVFIVKSYSSLASRRAKLFPHSIVWNSWTPIKVNFFAWEATWVKILTQGKLKRGVARCLTDVVYVK